jgi:hypothetical protein
MMFSRTAAPTITAAVPRASPTASSPRIVAFGALTPEGFRDTAKDQM